MKNLIYTTILLFLCQGLLTAQNGQIYGLNFVNSSLQFARLNPVDGSVEILSDGAISPDIFSQGVADFDPNTKSYFYLRGSSNNTELYQVNAITGDVVRRLSVANPNGAVMPITNLAYNWLEDKIYGVSHEFVGGNDRLRLCSIDLTNGALTLIASEPNSVGPYQSGNSDIDPIHRKYYYATSDQIVSVDLDSGEATTANINFPDNTVTQFLVNLTYNWQDQKIYGLHFLSVSDPNPLDTIYFTSQLRLATVDAATGQVDIISDLPTSPDGFSMGDCDIDPVNNRYFYIRQNQLYIVDLTTGELLNKVAIENPNSAIAPVINMVYDDLSDQTATLRMNMPEELSVEPGQSVELKAWVGDDAQYLWNDGSTEANREITEPGWYQVEITKGGFTVIGETTIDFTTSLVPTAFEERQLRLYPLPANEVLQYELTQTMDKALPLEILNANGQLVQRLLLSNQSGVLDLSDLGVGNYWVRLRRADQVELQPLLIVR